MFINFLNTFPVGIADGLQFALLALGVYVSYRILDFADLTVDGSFALGGAVAAVLINAGWNPILSMLIALLAGLTAGLCTATLNTKLKIPPILAGILTMLALYSINIRIMNKSNAPISKSTVLTYFQSFIPDSNFAIIFIGVIITGITIAVLYWFMGTELGASIRATGINSKMAKAQGINTDSTKTMGLMLSNGLVAVAGAFFAQCSFSANVDMGSGAIVIGLASVIIGEMLFGKKVPFWLKLISVVVGAMVYRLIISFALLLGLKSTDLKFISAIIVVIALSIPLIKEKIFKLASKKKFKMENNATNGDMSNVANDTTSENSSISNDNATGDDLIAIAEVNNNAKDN